MIAKNTEAKNYNYEGLVGFVSNFNFDFNEDGTYNCRIELMSHNTTTDGLKVPSVIDNLKKVKPADKEGEAEADVPNGFNNIVECICTSISRYNKKQGKVNCRELFDDPNVKLSSIGDWASNYDAYISTTPIPTYGPSEESGVPPSPAGETNFIAFLPFRFWLALFNVYAMPKVASGKENQLVRWSLRSNSWRGFKFMYSHNPDMVQLSRKATGETKDFNVKTGKSKSLNMQYYRGEDLAEINSANNRQILDIQLSTKLLKKVNSSFITNNPKKNDEIGLTDFVDLLLQEIQKYMGDINSFEIATSPRPVDNVYEELEIYDKAAPGEKGTLLNLSGLSTTVTSLGLKSNISGELQMVAMMSGAGTSGEGGKSQTGLENLNSPKDQPKAEDSMIKQAFTKGQSLSEGKEGKEQTESGEEIKAIITDLYEKWNTGGGNRFENVLDSSIDYVKSLVGGKSLGKFMPIPVDVDIEMLGVGGFRNLETFRLPDHLVPTRFGNTNFMILGIEHFLDSGESMWKTSITGILKPFNQ